MKISDTGIKILDIGVKGVFGALIAAAVVYYGNILQDERARVQEENRRLQAAIELTSRQKEFDVDLGMRLFGTLMGYYFQKNQAGAEPEYLRQQMLLLRLVALNFQDVPIHLKPLFENLDSQLTAAEDKARLRDIMREVAGRQAYRLTIDAGYDSGPTKVRAGDKLRFDELLTTVDILSVGPQGVRATIRSEATGRRPVGPFTITYFDTPLVDNVKIGEYRAALILYRAGTETAEVRFIAFPKHLAADRFDIQDLARMFRDVQMQ